MATKVWTELQPSPAIIIMQPSWKSSCFVFEDKLIDLFAFVKYVVMFGFFRLGNPIVLEIEGFSAGKKFVTCMMHFMNFFQKLRWKRSIYRFYWQRLCAKFLFKNLIQTSISQCEEPLNLISFCSFCSKLPDSLESNEEILLWVKAEPKRTLLTIG